MTRKLEAGQEKKKSRLLMGGEGCIVCDLNAKRACVLKYVRSFIVDSLQWYHR